jgi:hypothetical protein
MVATLLVEEVDAATADDDEHMKILYLSYACTPRVLSRSVEALGRGDAIES